MAPELRLGIVWRDERSAHPSMPDPRHGLAPLYAALEQLPVEVRPVVFEDGAADEVLDEVLQLDGALVWVNPIQDGANRQNLDALLRQTASRGVWVSADPAVILKLGTKEVLHTTRDVGWGVDTDIYRTPAEFSDRFPSWLGERGRVVLKQGRGNGGNGVWRVDLLDPHATPNPDAKVRVFDATSKDGSFGTTTVGEFVQRCAMYFAWSGCLVAQAFQQRLAEGMIRCYLSHDQVVGFCHQWPQGLLDAEQLRPPAVRSAMVGPDEPSYQQLRDLMERTWIPAMKEILGLKRSALPVIWDSDFLYGPRTSTGEDTYVLCEINVSAVWPFPPMAAATIASNAVAETRRWKARRPSADDESRFVLS